MPNQGPVCQIVTIDRAFQPPISLYFLVPQDVTVILGSVVWQPFLLRHWGTRTNSLTNKVEFDDQSERFAGNPATAHKATANRRGVLARGVGNVYPNRRLRRISLMEHESSGAGHGNLGGRNWRGYHVDLGRPVLFAGYRNRLCILGGLSSGPSRPDGVLPTGWLVTSYGRGPCSELMTGSTADG